MIVAKEKTQELFINFRFVLSLPNAPLGENKDILAKQCAIICVDEIIKSLEEYDERNDTHELQNMESSFRYWEEVRKELELL